MSIIVTLALFGFGCGRGGSSELMGRWVDVNSDTVLEIKSGKLVVSFGNYSESYPYKVKKSEGYTELVGTKPEGFGIVGSIEVRDDGSLRAYEQVLDGRGHEYRFVREEDLAAELEIKDLSKDLPKSIESKEIKNFSLSFENHGYGLGDEWPHGYYGWEINENDGVYKMYFSISGDSYMVMHWVEEVPEDYVRGLAEKLQSLGIIQHNGYYMMNNRAASGYSLYAYYASGEMLSVRADGDAADSCVFDLPGLLEYAKEQIGDELKNAY